MIIPKELRQCQLLVEELYIKLNEANDEIIRLREERDNKFISKRRVGW